MCELVSSYIPFAVHSEVASTKISPVMCMKRTEPRCEAVVLGEGRTTWSDLNWPDKFNFMLFRSRNEAGD